MRRTTRRQACFSRAPACVRRAGIVPARGTATVEIPADCMPPNATDPHECSNVKLTSLQLYTLATAYFPDLELDVDKVIVVNPKPLSASSAQVGEEPTFPEPIPTPDFTYA